MSVRPGGAAARVTAPPPSHAGSGRNLFGEDDPFDDSDAASLNLDLDLSRGKAPPKTSQAPVPARGPAGKESRAPGAVAKIDGAKPALPLAGAVSKPNAAPPPDPMAIDPFEARAVADYGPAPKGWWSAPAYAYRVKRRQTELRRVLSTKVDEAKRADTVAEDSLVAFAQKARALAADDATYATSLANIAATEDVLRERDTALVAQSDAHKQRQAELSAKIGELEKLLASAQSDERVVAGELAEAEALLKRAEARATRIETEIDQAKAARAANDASEPSGGVESASGSSGAMKNRATKGTPSV